DVDKQSARDQTHEQIEGLEAQTAKNQSDSKAQAQREVTALRTQWRQEIAQTHQAYDRDAGKAAADTHEKIETERRKGDEKVAAHYADANRDIEKEHAKAKEKEARERERAEEESSGFWGWVRSKAAALIDALKDAINFIYDNVRKAVKAVINLVKDLVLAVIDLVRSVVVGLLKGLGALLKGFVAIAFAAFPNLRKRINNLIDKGVDKATEYV